MNASRISDESKSDSVLERVYALLLASGLYGLTDAEGAELLGGDRLAFGRRRHELVVAGRARRGVDKRRGAGGHLSTVWLASK